MNKIPPIAGGLLGLIFVVFGLNYFLQFLEMPPMEEGSPPAMFFTAMAATGFLGFVKVLEIVGGVLTAIPKTRGIGLLILTPIVVNILGYHVFITSGGGLFDPPTILVTVLTGFLVWTHRAGLAGLVATPAPSAG